MESRATAKVSAFMQTFKHDMKNFVLTVDCSNEAKAVILQRIFNYDTLEFTKEDFTKRKRVKNVVPRCDRCCAKRANSEQCTRRRREGSMYCGTHIKGIPHGTVDSVSNGDAANLKQVELIAQEIKGIIYYLDSSGNVYNTEDVLSNITNPAIIATYVKDDDGNYTIPEFRFK